DLMYNPNFRVAQMDFYGQLQKYGFADFHSFYFSGGAADANSNFPYYHSIQQLPVKGDGSDGKTDNLLTLAVPGKTHSKSAPTSLDTFSDGTPRQVSVRGQAVLDWMAAYTSVPPTNTVTSSQPSATYGQSIAWTATLSGGSGAPTGTVQFK